MKFGTILFVIAIVFSSSALAADLRDQVLRECGVSMSKHLPAKPKR